jgi:hypothetical protein
MEYGVGEARTEMIIYILRENVPSNSPLVMVRAIAF